MFYHVSGEAVVWAIIGGIGSFLGPIVGTGMLIVLREELSHFWDHYLIIVGTRCHTNCYVFFQMELLDYLKKY